MKKIYNVVAYMLSFGFSWLPAKLRFIFWAATEPFGNLFFSCIRVAILKSYSTRIGEDIYIGKYTEIRSPQKLILGDRVSIQRGCYIDADGGLTIGEDVSIAHSCSIITFEHTFDDSTVVIRKSPPLYNHILIGNDVWVGCGVRILSGVQIGNRVVIAAGAVCVRNKNYDTSGVYAGVPAKLVKNIPDYK